MKIIWVVAIATVLVCCSAAMCAAQSQPSPAAQSHQRCDVGRLTLQTLVNTYPDSKYATDVARLAKDPSIAACTQPGDVWVEGGFDFDP
jgi:hypothetical protein